MWQKLHKKFEKKFLGFLSLSVSIWDLFHFENRNIHFGKAYWTTNTGHFDRFQHSNQRSPAKIRQKLNKIGNNREIFGILVIYWVNFLWQNCIYLFLENYWTTTSCLVERLQHSNLRCLSVNWQKTHENGKKWEILEFFFRGQFEIFFIKKTAINSLEKPTGLRRFPCWRFSTF